MSKVKNRNHYVPKFYLKGFCDANDKVWIYEKNNPLNPIASSPKNTAVIKKLYHLENNTKGLDEIENYFAEEIEKPASIIFKKLLKKEFPDGKDREILSLFFGMLMARTPQYLEHLANQQSKDLIHTLSVSASDELNFRNSYKNVHPNLSDDEIERDRQFILQGEFWLTLQYFPLS